MDKVRELLELFKGKKTYIFVIIYAILVLAGVQEDTGSIFNASGADIQSLVIAAIVGSLKAKWDRTVSG